MTVYIALLAVCINTCEFGYSKPVMLREECVAMVKKGIQDMPPDIKPFVSGTCIPVNIEKFM